MRSTLLRATGALSLAMGMIGACGGDESAAPGAIDAGSVEDAPTGIVAPPIDAAIEDAKATDAGDGGPTATAHPVVGYAVIGEIDYAFTHPYALAVDSTDHLYVSQRTDAPDTHTLYLTARDYNADIAAGEARILRFDSSGTYTGWIGAGSNASFGLHTPDAGTTAVYASAPGAFNMIRGMTFGANGHFFVLDRWKIQEFDASFDFVRFAGHGPSGYGWQTAGGTDTSGAPAAGGFQWPSCLRIHDGRFWVGNWYWYLPGYGFDPNAQYNAINVLDTTTGLGVGWLGGAYDSSNGMTTAGFTAVDAGKQPIASVVHSSSPGVFSSPRHFVWHDDKIYVVDDTSDPVLSVFDAQGVQQPGVLNHLTGVGEKPFAVAVDKYGNIIVSDMYTGSIRFFTTKLDANGEFTQAAEWQLDSPAVENISYPIISDFAWDSQDNLYVAASTMNKVYKIKLTY